MSDFNLKKKALFDSLEAVEKNLPRSNVEQYDEDFGRRQNERQRNDRYVDKYKNKGSIFKRPDLPISKCLPSRRRPDYEKNPQKYKHYSLSDVTDLSDRMNSSAAFNFLREMEDRRMGEQDKESSSESSKIVFKNSKKLEPKKDPVGEKKVKGNKFVMPEYVIGEKRQKTSKKEAPSSSTGSSRSTKSKQLKLSHLANDDEEEEDE